MRLFRRKRASSVIHHEVFYEDEITSVQNRPMFLGRAFSKARYRAAVVFLLCVISLLLGRAAYMQIAQGSSYQALAENNRLRKVAIPPKRGMIRDRNGRVLADNVPRFQVTFTPFNLPNDQAAVESEMSQAARLLGLSVNDLLPLAYATGTARDETTTVADEMPYAQAMNVAIALPTLPGFNLEVGSKRRYPQSDEVQSLSHILGYLGKLSPEEYTTAREDGYRRNDEIGKTGLEYSYESTLRGVLGEQVSEVDAHGTVKALVEDRPPVDGTDIQLTLDLELQKTAEKALKDELQKIGMARGAAIAIDPRDGSILAAVSLPAYDNNYFSGSVSSTYYKALIQNKDQPLFARAWAGTYPSGSTVKILIATAALAEGIITPNTTILSTGGLHIGPWFFPDWSPGGHGITNVRKAIALSVNTFFYTIGGGYESFVGLGVDRLSSWMKKFGLGSPTGVDIPGEGKGLVPSAEWKERAKGERWFMGDTYNLSIGQGDLLVTPLQVARYTATVANGGHLVVPHFMKQDQTEAPLVADNLEQDLQVVRKGMRQTVTDGSGRALSNMSFAVAGKTGTAQWSSEKDTHAWFTAFASYENPEIVVTVLLEEGGEGSSVAVPVSRLILQKWWELRATRQGAF